MKKERAYVIELADGDYVSAIRPDSYDQDPRLENALLFSQMSALSFMYEHAQPGRIMVCELVEQVIRQREIIEEYKV